jgi:hypothetical protein
MPGRDREDAIRENRRDLDTHLTNTPQHTAEEQTREQRHQPPRKAPPKRKPKG